MKKLAIATLLAFMLTLCACGNQSGSREAASVGTSSAASPESTENAAQDGGATADQATPKTDADSSRSEPHNENSTAQNGRETGADSTEEATEAQEGFEIPEITLD